MAEAGIFRADDRVELVEGVIVDMTPIGSRHAAVVARLDSMLSRVVGDEAIVWVQNPIVVGGDSEPQPDVALLRYRDDFYAPSHPTPTDVFLVMEVADASLRYDRDVKIPLYARHGVPEAWLLDLQARTLTVYSEPSVSGYKTAVNPEDMRKISVPGASGVTVDFSAVFCG